jgi:hypothetical protein
MPNRPARIDRPASAVLRVVLIGVLALAASVACMRLYGAHRWQEGTQELRSRLEAAREPVRPATVDLRELKGLPAPVARYLRAVLVDGQPMVTGARIRHTGTFDMGQETASWKPFTSDQAVVTRRPGFDWDGSVSMRPGVPVRVHDAYVAGEGVLTARVLGLFPVADQRGVGDVAEGELMRYLAEAAWYPTALLPSQGVRWAAVDDRSASATMSDGDVVVSLLFAFDDEGFITSVGTQTRGRTVGGKVVPTPWQGRFWNYTERGGMRVPLDGEVAWLLPEGAKPYWRGHTDEITHEFAR